MKWKNLFVFSAAVALSLAAAHHQWDDSGHTTGRISVTGGQARHPAVMPTGRNRYTQLVTATVAAPYRGNARIELEDLPKTEYEIILQKPVIRLGPRRPRVENDTVYDLEPGDRISLWVVITPVTPDSIKGKYTLTFYDTTANRSLLTIPFIFQSEDVRHADRSQE